MTRTVLLGNRRLAVAVGRYLADRGDLVGVVVHPEGSQDCGPQLRALSPRCWEWPADRAAIRALAPECLFSVLFGYRLDADWLAIPGWGAVNLHPGLLPLNRGRAPYAWPLVDGTPAGTTLHVMDEGLDTGPILCQEEVPVFPEDTAVTVFRRLEAVSLVMVRRVWPGLREVTPTPQRGPVTTHRLADLRALDLTPEDLPTLDKLRARTFPPFGAEFERDGRRYRATVAIEPVD